MFPRSAFVLLLLALMPVGALAQQVPSPPGAIGGVFGGRRSQPDPGRASSRWTMTFLASGGVDEEPVELGSDDPGAPSAIGSAATVSATTEFVRGRTGRQVEVNAGGFYNRQELQSGQMRGANGRVQGQYDATQRFSLTGGAGVNYQPMVLGQPVTAFAPGLGDPIAPPPDVLGPPPGVEEELWISTTGNVGLTRGWTPRQRLELNYTDYRSQPIEGAGFESHSRLLSAREVWNATPRFELRFGYSYEETSQSNGGPISIPTEIHSAVMGFDYERPLGPTRSLTFIFEGGADIAETLTAPEHTGQSVMPSAAGSIEWQFSERWSLSLRGSHEATVLPGVTPMPFTTNQGTFQIGGTIVGRLSLAAFGSYAEGTAFEGQPGSYRAATGTAQVNYGLSRCCSMFASVGYYDHRLTDVTTAIGFPGTYARRTARVGFSYWLPLYGTF